MSSRVLRMALIIVVGIRLNGLLASLGAETQGPENAPVSLWDLAQSKQTVHRFSTLFTAQNVRDHLATEAGLAAAIAWCRQTAVTKVYLETFRSKYTAERDTLRRARDRFRSEGFAVSGCVTTTIVGKPSTGWNLISCYTDRATQDIVGMTGLPLVPCHDFPTNFADERVAVKLDGKPHELAPREWTCHWK